MYLVLRHLNMRFYFQNNFQKHAFLSRVLNNITCSYYRSTYKTHIFNAMNLNIWIMKIGRYWTGGRVSSNRGYRDNQNLNRVIFIRVMDKSIKQILSDGNCRRRFIFTREFVVSMGENQNFSKASIRRDLIKK